MLNIPGTLLIVKAVILNKPANLTAYRKTLTAEEYLRSYELDCKHKKSILYGDFCMMLDYYDAFKIHNNKLNIKCLKLLYNKEIIHFYDSSSKIQKLCFTYPDIWVKKGFDKQLKEFEKNGSLDFLKKTRLYP